MFGFHDRETAERIAREKSKEHGQEYTVLPAEVADGPEGMFTIGVKIKAMTGADLIKRLKEQAKGG